MKTLSGRGPRSIATAPNARWPMLSGFELEAHATGWTATRHAGRLVESVALEATRSRAELDATPPDGEVEWTVTVRCSPDPTWLSGATAAGSALVSAAAAFWLTFQALDWLPRKASAYFALATLLVVVTFGVVFASLYRATAALARRLVARMERRPTRAVLVRVERLATLASEVPALGISRASEASQTPGRR